MPLSSSVDGFTPSDVERKLGLMAAKAKEREAEDVGWWETVAGWNKRAADAGD